MLFEGRVTLEGYARIYCIKNIAKNESIIFRSPL